MFKIDYSVIDDPAFPGLVRDLSMLHAAGIKIAIVPGVEETAAFEVSNRVMTMLSANGVTAVIGNWVKARGIGVIDGLDYKSAGTVESVRVESVRRVLDDGVTPIFPCVGWSDVGKAYNISAYELAVFVAGKLAAEKLYFITSHKGYTADEYHVPDGVTIAPESRLANFNPASLDVFIAANPGREKELEPLRHAGQACAAGVERVHILNGGSDGVILLETFSNLGFGTMVYSNSTAGYPMEPNDIADVLRIMQPFVDRGILLPRSAAQLREMLRDFIVFEVDDLVHACAACTSIHRKPQRLPNRRGGAVSHLLALDPRWWATSCEMARRKGLAYVFALTTYLDRGLV